MALKTGGAAGGGGGERVPVACGASTCPAVSGPGAEVDGLASDGGAGGNDTAMADPSPIATASGTDMRGSLKNG